MIFFVAAVVIGIIVKVFFSWLSFTDTLSSGDWPYLFLENIKEFSFVPQPEFLWLAPYYQIPTKIFVEYLNVPWEIFERLFWFWPFVLLCIISSYYLTKSWVGVLVYTANTYILMVVGGGQMGVALAYALAPLVLKSFINVIDRTVSRYQNIKYQISNIKNSLVTGVYLAILTMFDPRIGYATMLAVFLYFLFHFRLKAIVAVFLIPVALATVLNLYWIVSMIRNGVPIESAGFASVAGFRYLSFTDFSNAFGLLHPNWPENIFGKVSFMKPEFLLLPIVAFASLLFVKRSDKRILFFALLALVGAFLAKGAREPFGIVNELLFQYIPGMSMFRDATKFYILIALSYAVLIPYSLVKISALNKNYGKYIVYGLFFVLFLFSIRQAFLGELGGTFKSREVPKEYIMLKDYILREPAFFTTFWIPSQQRFGLSSKNHPAINAQAYFDASSVKEIQDKFTNNDSPQFLRDAAVGFVIVPYDSEGELFVTDRRYDETLYMETIQTLEGIPWLIRRSDFGKLAVFEVQ